MVGQRRSARAVIAVLAAALVLSGCTVAITGEAATWPGVTVPTDRPTTAATTPTMTPPATHATTPAPTRSTTTTPSAASSPPATRTTTTSVDPQDADDATADTILAALAIALKSGNAQAFLQPFAATLQGRQRAWFDNTRRLGVSATRFVRSRDDYGSGADSATKFTRNVVVGVGTPYDDVGAIPGIIYAATFGKAAGRWQLTAWKAAFVEDPMDCACTLDVAKSGNVAVVSAPHDDLEGWASITLQNTVEGVAWTRQRLGNSGLKSPKGQVVYLADAPFHWFQSLTRPAQESNVTVPQLDATGDRPGETYSGVCRIVVALSDSQGGVVPQNEKGVLYDWDVVTHEAVHQLLQDNSQLDYSVNSPIETWVVEGIAAAVETLHRRDHPETTAAGYPLPDDPANVDPDWLNAHVTTTLPTREQLYSSSLEERSNWYAVAASVYLYLAATSGFATMMTVARQVYSGNNRTPFLYFPDPKKAGHYLTDVAARKTWLDWFRHTYEG